MEDKLKNNYLNLLLYFADNIQRLSDMLFEKIEKLTINNSFACLKIARYYKKNNLKKSYVFYLQYLKNNPDDITVTIEFAQFSTDRNEIEQSMIICKNGLIKHKNHISLLLIMCQNFLKLKDYCHTINYALNVLANDEKNEYAYKFLCDAYFNLGQENKLKDIIKKLISFKSQDIEIKKEIARILNSSQNFYCEAMDFLENNIDFNSKNILEISIQKTCYLKYKKLNNGLKFYNKILEPKFHEEARKSMLSPDETIPQKIYNYYKHIWKGENLKNKILFIFDYKCGYGDFILFSRYIPILQKKAKKIIIEVKDNIYDLYKYNFPEAEIILTQAGIFKNFDYSYHHEMFLNLQQNLEIFPDSQGYLNVNKDLIKKYSEIIKSDKFKIGIFWKNFSGIDNKRSIMNTEEIIPILDNDQIQFYSLSKDELDYHSKQIMQKYNVIDCASYIQNAHATAAIMKNLDLVISTDSFPIHLAGALGVKAFLMLPLESDWRWFFDTKKTPWYDSVTIFKQKTAGDWSGVVERIATELEKLTLTNCSP